MTSHWLYWGCIAHHHQLSHWGWWILTNCTCFQVSFGWKLPCKLPFRKSQWSSVSGVPKAWHFLNHDYGIGTDRMILLIMTDETSGPVIRSFGILQIPMRTIRKRVHIHKSIRFHWFSLKFVGLNALPGCHVDIDMGYPVILCLLVSGAIVM